MFFLQKKEKKIAMIGICLSIFLSALFTIIPGLKLQAECCHENEGIATQILALKLETTFANAIIEKNIPAISRMVSDIYQGWDQGGFIRSKSDLIVQLNNSGVTSINFQEIFATRNRNTLVVTFRATGTTEKSSFNSSVVSVWTKVMNGKSGRHYCHKCRNGHKPQVEVNGMEKWQLVSQTSIPSIEEPNPNPNPGL